MGDDTSLVIYVPHAPALIKNWQGTPWMKMWHDEQVQKYFAPLREQMKVDEWDERCKTNTGYTMAGLLDFATGEAIFVMPDLGAVITAAKNKTAPPLLVAVEIGDNGAKIEQLIADAEAKDKDKEFGRNTEDFNGAVTLHICTVRTWRKRRRIGAFQYLGDRRPRLLRQPVQGISPADVGRGQARRP